MLSRIGKPEGDCYFRIKAFNALRGEILSRIEDQPVNAGLQSDFLRN